MFREMLRKNNALPQAECIRLLTEQTRGVLSVLGEGGYPYGTPMNHFYNPDDGCLYFHCGRYPSHRTDALRRCGKVSFCVYDEGTRAAGEWAYTVNSVIVFGRMEILDDPALVEDIAVRLCRKFTADEDYIRAEIENHARNTLILKLTPEHLCGKRVREE